MYDFRNFFDAIPKKERNIINSISKYGADVYVVGGAVRDFLIGIKPNDYDLVTNISPAEIKYILSKELPTSKINDVGKLFGIIICDGVEIATFREDYYNKNGNNKDVIISFCKTIEEDLSRRDFTISSMALCTETGRIIDPFNGMEDLDSKIIRFVGNPFDRINEDPNRMVRVARFAAKIDGTIHPDTLDAIRSSHHLFHKVAKERISKEIIKAMKIKKASKFFIALHDMGLLQYILPTLDKCWGHDGGPYHDEDLFTHMMMAGDYLSTRCYILKLAGYLHDIGKVKAYDSIERSFLRHENFGEFVAQKELKNLKFSNEEINKIKSYVRFHMRNNYGKEKSVRKLIRELHENGLNYRSHTRLKCADRAGNLRKPNFVFSQIKEILTKYEDLFTGKDDSVFSIKDLKINGNDLMEAFNLEPGRIIGDILRFTLEAIYDTNVSNNKEDIISFIKNNFNFKE